VATLRLKTENPTHDHPSMIVGLAALPLLGIGATSARIVAGTLAQVLGPRRRTASAVRGVPRAELARLPPGSPGAALHGASISVGSWRPFSWSRAGKIASSHPRTPTGCCATSRRRSCGSAPAPAMCPCSTPRLWRWTGFAPRPTAG